MTIKKLWVIGGLECTLRDKGGTNLLCGLHGARINHGTSNLPKDWTWDRLNQASGVKSHSTKSISAFPSNRREGQTRGVT